MNQQTLIELVHSTKDIIMDKDMARAVTVKGAADYVTKVDFAVQEYLRAEQSLPRTRAFSPRSRKTGILTRPVPTGFSTPSTAPPT